MKKILLATFLVAMMVTSTNVNAKNVPAVSDETTSSSTSFLTGINLQSLQGLDLVDNKNVAQFIVNASPDLSSADIDNVVKALDYLELLITGKIDKAIEILTANRENIKTTIDTIKSYLQKDVPLYLYLMKNREKPEMADVDAYKVDTVWAAPVDEMYYGLGDERNTYKPYGFTAVEQEAAKAMGARVKHNQSYLWGMVTVGNKVYWCTNTNYLCVGGSSSGLGTGSEPGQDVSQGYANNCWVCEFESGIYGKTVHAKVDPSYAQYSDTRIPRIYSYDTTTGIVLDITPSGGDYDMMLQNCQGLRSAGAFNGVAFFGGPSLYGSSAGTTIGSSFFAYDTDEEKFIGCNDMSKVLDADGLEHKVTDIRRWYVYKGVLYAGVRVTDSNGTDRGAIIRWYGSKEDPWNFKVVGWTANEAAELCVYNGYMYVGGWNTTNFAMSTVDKGDLVPEDGLQPVSVSYPEYTHIWKYTDYDTNRLNITTTYTAGLQVWNGKLYWGMFAAAYTIPTMCAKFGYKDFTSPEAIAFILGHLRQTSFWRVDADNNIELLYGESELPTWNRLTTGEDTWTMKSNGYTPKFGRAGYGQLFTAYTWTMAEYHNDLYCGTMNMENLIGAVADNGNETAGSFYKALELLCGIKKSNFGFELLRWQDPETAPEYITTNGFGNGSAYGIRNFTIQGDDLYVGSASPLNLETYGGCHLFKVNDGKVYDENTGEYKTSATITGINQVQTKDAGIYVKRNGNSITIATVNGENLTDVNISDLAGKTIASGKPASNVITLDASNGPVIIRVSSEKGSWSGKIK